MGRSPETVPDLSTCGCSVIDSPMVMKPGTTTGGAQIKRPPVVKVVTAEIVAAGLLCSIIMSVNPLLGKSALIGSGICLLPNLYFSLLAFRYSGAKAVQAVAQHFYRAEVGKFMLTATLFAVTFSTVKPLNAAAVFIAYLVTLMVNWLLMAKVIR